MSARSGLAGRINEQNAKWYILVASCFGLFMAILDNLVVNIAMPTISRDLDATPTQLQWIVSAYTLVFASLQITAGGLGDRFGRKRWFLTGLVVFTATSLAAAFSQNIEMLIALRAAQGLGAALIMPLSLSLISQAFPPEERGRAVGIWGAISVSGVALGPIVGGALVEYASWHWVFLINVPIGLIALFIASTVVPESRDESGTVATDIPGTILITAGIASLTWGLIEAGNRGWGDSLILSSFVAAAVLAVAFIFVEARTERPMIPLGFFRSRTFTGANIDAFMISFLITGVSFFLTMY
jgi:EmrB/QacA subfamily drug resistance transporter